MFRIKFGEEEEEEEEAKGGGGVDVGVYRVWKAIQKWWPLVFARSSFTLGNGWGVKF